MALYGKFKKKPVIVDAVRWWRNGDHPEDRSELCTINGLVYLGDGNVVKRYRNQGMTDLLICKHCANRMTDHGWISTLEGGHIVCPGDWIIKGIAGEFYPCKHKIFTETYEEVTLEGGGRR